MNDADLQDKDENAIYENKYWQICCQIKINPDNVVNIVNQFVKDNEQIKAYKDGVNLLLAEDCISNALELINEGITKYKFDEILLLKKVDCLLKDDCQDDAISIILKDLNKTPDSILKLASIYKDSKQIDKAIDILNDGYLSFPNSENILFMYAELAYDNDLLKESLYLYDRLINKFSSNVTYWGYFANVCLSLDIYDKAMIAYRKADELSKSEAGWIIGNIGNVLINRGLYSEGKNYLQKMLELNPESDYPFKRINFLLEQQNIENEKYNDLTKEGKKLIRDSNNSKQQKATG